MIFKVVYREKQVTHPILYLFYFNYIYIYIYENQLFLYKICVQKCKVNHRKITKKGTDFSIPNILVSLLFNQLFR